MVAQDARTQRMNRLKRENRYGENAAGKWVRSSAFREIDCDPSDPTHLREFDTFEEAFAFDEECRLNGTGGRKAVHLPKPKDTVPKEQLALAPKRKRKAEAEALQPPMMKRPSHNHNPEVSDPELNNPELKNPELNNPVPPVLPVVKKEAQFEELDDAIKKLSAHSDLDGRGTDILAAATTLRDSMGRDRANALRSMCNAWGVERREKISGKWKNRRLPVLEAELNDSVCLAAAQWQPNSHGQPEQLDVREQAATETAHHDARMDGEAFQERVVPDDAA